jgi:thioredoxin 1
VTVTYTQDSEFDTLLADSELVMVDCTATWCGPCRKISPLMDQLSEEYVGRAKVVKLDVDENKATAKKLGIRSIPAVFLFKGGELVETIVGVEPYEKFRDALEQHL